LSDFSLFITPKMPVSCFRKNDEYNPTNENAILVKTGIPKV